MNEVLREVLINDWFQLASTFGIIIAWFVDRRKRKVDFTSSRASMLDNIDDLYNKFSERFQKEYKALLTKVQELEEALEAANLDRKDLMNKIEQFEKQSTTDKELIRELTAKVDKQQETIEIQRMKISQLERMRL